jgi:putative transposase
MLRDLLRCDGVVVGCRHVSMLMKQMGIEAIYRRPNTRKSSSGHKIYPYLLRGVPIDRPNQVWVTNISYMPMRRSFVYIVAVVYVFTRRVLSHRVSITIEAEFCVEALKEALEKYGKTEIFNPDRGSQFISSDFIGVQLDARISISMECKGVWRDNGFVKRLWRSVKYEEVYLRACEVRVSLGRYLALYNEWRSHYCLDGRTADNAYYGKQEMAVAA